MRSQTLRADLLMLLTAMIWGSAFVAQRVGACPRIRFFVGWAELREAQHADFVGLRSSAPTYNLQSIAILGQPPRHGLDRPIPL